MANRRPGAPALAGAFVLLALALQAAAFTSCSSSRTIYLTGSATDRAELRELFSLLDSGKLDSIERFAAVRQVSSVLLSRKEYGRLTLLLTELADENPDDPYTAYYLYAAASVYDLEGSKPIAALYYDRVVKNYADLEVDGKSIHYQSLSRLIETIDSPERRIEYYKDLIARFPDRVEMGKVLFLLGEEYEKVGQWDEAVKAYANFPNYYSTSIPGHPDALQYARTVVEFSTSPKDWSYESLGQLVDKVKTALQAGDPYKLRSLRAKVGFFAMSWHQDDNDLDSQVLFDFSEFMTRGRVFYSDTLDASSGPRDAYLKTWGWSERISTWYLYFRKINFPADPEIHGRWEWAGIYFGEKMQ